MKNAPSAALTTLYLALAVAPPLAMALGAPDAAVNGALPPAVRPQFSSRAFTSESYQHESTHWFEAGLGLRGVAVHVDNSILYHAFRETKTGAPVKVGTGALFNDEDIAYFSKTGNDLPKPEELDRLAALIKRAQVELARRGGALVPVVIPSKSTLYPDDVPPAWRQGLGFPRPSDTHVYGAFRAALERHGVTFVDARALLTQSQHPREDLWGLDGRHWSYFGACLTMRAVFETYARMSARPAPPYECVLQRNPAPPAWHDDYDLFRLLNVWGASPSATITANVAHPEAATTKTARAPKTVFIGTSFTWALLKDSSAAAATQDAHFLYYNKLVVTWPTGEQAPVDPKSALWQQSVLGQDLYVLDILETYLPSQYATEFLGDLAAQLGASAEPR
ncbi:MAG: hypothetical protein HOO96_35360 [Polyangiaceae bacterium]|nr:hypothetical protein [Polyangiaceae bacterium]